MTCQLDDDIARLCGAGAGPGQAGTGTRCHHQTDTDPLTRLGPFQLELLHTEPAIAIINNFVSHR